MLQLNNMNDSLKYLIDISRDLSTLTGNDDQKLPSYWVRTVNEFSSALTVKNITVYNNVNHESNQSYEGRITPEEFRFLKIKEKFQEIYYEEEEALSSEFMVEKPDGKKKVNDDWLRINKNFEEGEFCREDENLFFSTKENDGYRIIIKSYSNEEKKRGLVNIELPISSLYRAATFIDNKGFKKPRYPYAVIYGIYNCFKYSVSPERISPRILEVIDNIYSRRETLLEKEKGKLNSAMESVKRSMGSLINNNKSSFKNLSDQIESGLVELDDDKIDEVAEQCHSAIAMFTENSEKDLSQVISSMISADEEKVRSTMQNFGLTENNIRSLIDSKSGGMTNEELKNSLNIDELLNFN